MKKKTNLQKICAFGLAIALVVTYHPCSMAAISRAFDPDVSETINDYAEDREWSTWRIKSPVNPLSPHSDTVYRSGWRSTFGGVYAYWHHDNQQKYYADSTSMNFEYLWGLGMSLSSGNGENIVEVAASQIGNVGGQTYWSWYGFHHREDWCAIFVAWCANQLGYDTSVIPKEAGAGNMRQWFRDRGREASPQQHTPEPGDIIFFIWNGTTARLASHVGIVEKCEGGKVYTIEGNSGGGVGKVRRKSYNLSNSQIVAYGIPDYPAPDVDETE